MSFLVVGMLSEFELMDHSHVVAETLETTALRPNVREYLESELRACESEIVYRAALTSLVTGQA